MKKIYSIIVAILGTMCFIFPKISIEVEAKDYVNYDYNLSDESSNIELLNEELENYLDLYEDYLIFNKKNIYSSNLPIDNFQTTVINSTETDDERKRYFFEVGYNLLTGERIGFYLYYYDDEILTPNGFSISTRRMDSEIPDEFIEHFYVDMESEEINVEREIQSPTAYYNCHSYAWYSQDITSNKMWMDYPDQYYNVLDQSYVRVYEPRENDIICYYSTNSEGEKVNIHSAIIKEVLNVEADNEVFGLNKYIVESKWGLSGLYLHRGDQCPYMTSFGGETDEVRYYRPRTDDSCNLSNSMNTLSVTKTINGNGTITEKYGMYELNVRNSNYYTIYVQAQHPLNNRLYNSNMGLESMTIVASNLNTYRYVVYLSSGIYYLRTALNNLSYSGTISVSLELHDHLYTYTQNGSNHTARCTTCNYTTTFSHVYDEHYCIHCNAYTSAHDYDRNY